MPFLPKDYTVPEPTSNYLKFVEGENPFRILGSFEDQTAIMGYEYWITLPDGKRSPVRKRMGETISQNELEINPKTDKPDMPRHFWALPVWNYASNSVQILEITQRTIMNYIKSLAQNPKWGDPREYDIVVTRVEGDITSYLVNLIQKRP